MNKYLAGGLLFVAGLIVGSGLMWGYYNNQFITCKCTKSGGDRIWSGNCPDDVKQYLLDNVAGFCQ
jgi:hypothetical protein